MTATPALPLTVGPAATDADVAAYVDAVASNFGWNPAETDPWVRGHGLETIRVIRAQSRIAGGLMLLPFGTYFGGRVVPTIGVAAVVVWPEFRGQGVGRTLMHAAVREIADRAIPLAGLFPATWPVYRAAGFELAASRSTIKLDLARIQLAPTSSHGDDGRDLTLAPALPADDPAIFALYERLAAGRPGHLARSRALWDVKIFRRARAPSEAVPRPYVLRRQSEIVGFFCFTQERPPGQKFNLALTDAFFADPPAARRFLLFLADHWSIAGFAIWNGSPAWDVLLHLRDRCFTAEFRDHVMLRVIDPAAALSARGYPAGLAARLPLRITDPLLPAHSATYLLTIAGGRGECRRTETIAGLPTLTLAAPTLAPLFSGYHSAGDLVRTGRLAGPADLVALADAAFAGPAPWLTEIY